MFKQLFWMAIGVVCLFNGAAQAQDGDVGACCFEGKGCAQMPADVCEESGGQWQGAGTNCDDFPCGGSDGWGACCIGDFGPPECFMASEDVCESVMGHWSAEGCDQVKCQPYCIAKAMSTATAWSASTTF